MSLADTVAEHNIDLQALKGIRKRVFVVGRFNNANDGGDPAAYLLTGREPAADFAKNFSGVGALSYDAFVKLVQPKIAEELDADGLIPQVRQKIPGGQSTSGESLSVLDHYNYFFLRAIATSEQEAFRREQPNLKDYLSSDPGMSIFKQIRSSLAAFCEFQPKHPELIDALAKLFKGCQGGKAISRGYAEGRAFPIGLPERLIDYLYAEDTNLPFDLEGIDFSPEIWRHLQTDEKAREELSNIVGAFRACLLNGTAEQYGGKTVGQKTLRSVAESSRCGEPLRRDFAVSRDAYNKLRQILRNRVLLSMVLEWVVSSIYERPEVQKKGDDDYSKDVLVQEAIRSGKLGLAPPVKRPDAEQQVSISDLLVHNLKELVGAVVSGDAAGLPEGLRSVAGDMLRNEGMVNALRLIAGVRQGSGGAASDENYQAFLDAAKVLLKDVVCATLFQKPILSLAQLYMYASAELKTAYLAAEFLQPQNEVDIRRMAQSHLKEFQEKLEGKTLLSGDDTFVPALLQDFLRILANPAIATQVESNMRVIDRVLPVMLGRSGESRVSDVAGLEGGTTAQRTSPDVEEKLEIVLEEVLEGMTSTMFAQAGAGAAAAAADPPAQSFAPTAPADAAGPDAGLPQNGEQPKPEGANAFERILTDIILESVEVDDLPAANTGAALHELSEKVKERAAPQLREVKGVLGDDVKVFRQLLRRIYETYNQQGQDKAEFRNRVERLTLINMLLANQRELRIGDIQSNLYQMLIDMVMSLDSQKPNPEKFLRENSLTKYFENEVFAGEDGEGMATLRNTLRTQAEESLANVVKFVSELRGVKYLLDYLGKDSDAEVVVVNAAAGEFLSWLRTHNLTVIQQGRPHLMRADLIVGAANDTALPGLVVMTELAFENQESKEGFITDLTNFNPVQGGFRVVLPPACLSTEAWDADGQWYRNGKALADLAAAAASPVLIVSPAAHMNRHDDGLFPTTLSGGFLLAAHFLKEGRQQIVIRDVAETGFERLAVIGGLATGITPKLEEVFWPPRAGAYSFAADFYLYLILVIEASIVSNGGSLSAESYFDCFRAEMGNGAYASSEIIGDALVGGKAYQFSLSNPITTAEDELAGVRLLKGNTSVIKIQDGEQTVAGNVGWFSAARRRLNLP